jgi:hypothetical protein
MAILVFAPILVAPGALVWWRPRGPWLAIWAIWSFISSVTYLVAGSPYTHEREQADWLWVMWPTWIAIVLAIVGATVVAFLLAARARAPRPATPRTRRIQQATRLSVALALVTVVLTALAVDVPLAAVFWNAAVVLFIIAPAPFVDRVAQRGPTIMWASWTSPFAAIIAFLWLLDGTARPELPVRIWMTTHGTLFVMIAIVTPLVAFLSSDEQSDLPTARVSS